METESRRRVQIQIGMMNAVQAPEPRHLLREDVPGAERGVHGCHSQRHLRAGR